MAFFNISNEEDFQKGLKYEQSENYAKAFEFYQKAASRSDNRNSEAEFRLAECYYHGLGTVKNYEKAFEYYKKSSGLKNAKALLMVCVCYGFGYGTDIDGEKAVFNLIQAMKNGANVECFVKFVKENKQIFLLRAVIKYYFEQGDYQKVYSIIYDMDNCDDGVIKEILAYCCFYGKGTAVDKTRAVILYQQLADKNNSKAAQILADYYREKDLDRASDLYLKAIRCSKGRDVKKMLCALEKLAELGNASAMLNLYYCYAEGFFGEKSDSEIQIRLYEAAKRGSGVAQGILAECYYKGVREEKNFDLAFKWANAASESRDSKGDYYVGMCYYFGNGTEKSITQAVSYIKRAAEKRYPRAYYWLGYLCKYGIVFEKNLKKAFEYYSIGAKLGERDAKIQLGKCYLDGLGTEVNLKAAEMCFLDAGACDDEIVQYNLGLCYSEMGEKYEHDAFFYFQESAKKNYAPSMRKLAELYVCNQRVCWGFMSAEDRFKEAIKIAEKAAEQGDEKAKENVKNYKKELLEFEKIKRVRETMRENVSEGSGDVCGLDSVYPRGMTPNEYRQQYCPSLYTPGGVDAIRNDPNLTEIEKEAVLSNYRIYAD